jgi:cell division protein ZapE
MVVGNGRLPFGIIRAFINLLHKIIGIEELLKLAANPLSASEILSDLDPPSHFDKAEFSNYIPDPLYPSQSNALAKVQDFVNELEHRSEEKTSLLSRFIKKEKPAGRGAYLDGGFGVGKTHLLASAFHSYKGGKKAYLSFQELMFLVGLQSLAKTAHVLKHYRLLVIDEFELDDPANTRISTNLLGQLLQSGVHIITSSNTPPGALGKEKFSSEDFIREIGELTRYFYNVRIDGEDYRVTHHLRGTAFSTWFDKDNIEFEGTINSLKQSLNPIIEIEYKHLLHFLSSAHPIRIRSTMKGIRGLIITTFEQFSHPHEALRFVYFIDKVYDDNIPIIISSNVPLTDIFHPSIMHGGDTKKYRRTLSRLREMTQTTSELLNLAGISTITGK